MTETQKLQQEKLENAYAKVIGPEGERSEAQQMIYDHWERTSRRPTMDPADGFNQAMANQREGSRLWMINEMAMADGKTLITQT